MFLTHDQNHYKQKWTSIVISFIPAVIWMAFIFYSSSQTGDELGSLLPLVQTFLPFIESFNFMHYITYFILAMTLDYGFAQKSSTIKYKILIVLLCTLYGVSDEFHQTFVGGRMPDMMDIRNDALGAIAWVLLFSIPFLRGLWNKIPRMK